MFINYRLVTTVAIVASTVGPCRLLRRPAPEDPPARSNTPARSNDIQPPGGMRKIMALIHSVKPWPVFGADDEYTQKDWARLIEVAARLQLADRVTLKMAFSDYIQHYATAWEEGVDKIDEWSKPFLILRTMYEVPFSENPYGNDEESPCAPTFFGGFVYMTMDDESFEATIADPIRWTEQGPILTVRRGGYMGADYKAYLEHFCFMRHFKLRDLNKYLTKDDQ